MNARTPLFGLALWSLLCLWVFFGGLELVEQLQVIQETDAEDQQGRDLDEEALSQLASGLKSNVPILATPSVTVVSFVVPPSSVSVFQPTVQPHSQLLLRHPSLLPLHKQFSVYRI